MQITVPVSSQAVKSGSQNRSRSWMEGRPRFDGSSVKATAWKPRAALRRTSAAARVGSHNGTRPSGIRRPSTGTAPLLAHPVVEGPDTGQRQVLVLGLEEHLAGEAWEGGEAHGAFRLVEVHVGQAGHRVVAPRSHGGEGDRGRGQLVAGEADARHHLGDRPHEVLVDPPVHHRAVAAAHVLDVVGARHLHRLAAVLLNVGPARPERGRQPRRPDVRRFDHVVVDRDHPGQLRLGQLASSNVTAASHLARRPHPTQPVAGGQGGAAAPVVTCRHAALAPATAPEPVVRLPDATTDELLRAVAAAHGDREAYVDAHGERLTFAAWDRAADGTASGLRRARGRRG